MRLKTILISCALVAVSFVAALKVMDYVSPRGTGPAPVLVQLPPLPAAPRISTIIAPINVELNAIREAADKGAPRNFGGKADNPVPQLLQNANINWTAARGPIAATGATDTLTLSTPLTGALTVTGSLSSNVRDQLSGALGGLLGGNVAKQIGSINIKNINANAEIRGNVTMTSKPQLTTNWRVEPNLAAQVNLGDTSVSMAGAKINVPAQVKPVIDKAVNEQIAAVQAKLRNDPALEQNARREWAKLCRSIPLQGASAVQGLYLELKPLRAVAAQPRVDASAVTLTIGVEAETRVTATQTKPDCPFPATLMLVPPSPGKIDIAVPVDMPFTELNKIIEAQFAGKTYPEDGSGSVDVTVKKATVAASGDRLLISLLVNAKEKKSWFGLGGEATVHIWGKPVLDPVAQTLRLTDVELAVESEAAFGLLGTAARAAMPYLQKTLADNATIDLKPFASNTQKRIAVAMADFQKNEAGIRVSADITALRLAGIAFDSKTLRVIAEADGAINVGVTALPGL
jgi:predicted small integral membrane protein